MSQLNLNFGDKPTTEKISVCVQFPAYRNSKQSHNKENIKTTRIRYPKNLLRTSS